MLNQSVISALQYGNDIFVGIDRVELSVPLGEDKALKYKQMRNVRERFTDGTYPEPKIRQGKFSNSNAWIAGFSKPGNGNTRILTIIAGATCGNPYVKLRLNPSKLLCDDWFFIELWTISLFDESLDSLMKRCTVSTIEIYADVRDIPHDAVLPIWQYKLEKHVYIGKTSRTIYGGTRKSKLSIACYDKRQQLADTNGPYLPIPVTRVEVRLHPTGITLRDMAEGNLPNPFYGRIFVTTPALLKKFCALYKSDSLLDQLLAHCSLNGINKYAKKNMANRLPEYCIPAWKPEKFWLSIQEMLKRFFPDLSGQLYSL
ncbi:replication initiation factor domain-containing protein [Burkholderia multivorans]|uniref:replication initiation factor domain-containing protein n=1 Tax=Burkholderia multivorans TaxID=87883 RepID=UPI001C213D4F|nr:replication initiation factor domain-containing protein [Burkholderia multivorans]MBU9491755.1 replication initiation factor domain-containing protein [Burkholderia multivorans]